MTIRQIVFIMLITLLPVTATLAAQDGEDSPFSFDMGIALGVETFNDGTDGEEVSYQKIGIQPEFSIGKWGMALDLSFHVRSGSGDNILEFRTEDWVPDDDSFSDWMELYLSKFLYLRYGQKGDPLYGRFGTISNGTLGTGFIMGGYANTMFYPDDKLLGLALDVDGALVNFPLIGFETIVGNLAAMDVMGTRLYLRPLVSMDSQILQNLELGFTAAMDRDPAYREEYFTELDYYTVDGDGNLTTSIDPVQMWGVDLIQPILSRDILSLAVYTAFAAQPGTGDNNETATGEMFGIGGRLIKIIPYTAQIRILGENFTPSYFDTSYDLYRGYKYATLAGLAEDSPAMVGWLTATGFSLFEDMVVFNAMVEGPFDPVPTTDSEDKFDYSSSQFPHLSMFLTL
ncbi:MAG: hypothetical protein PQJ60_08685, partial [Spirochaetales bacterium]|nr:hypothetical protein [Spirochaetales bacterium]